MDNTEAVVAVYDRVDYDSDRIDVINLVKVSVLHIHLAVYAVNALDSSLYPCALYDLGYSLVYP